MEWKWGCYRLASNLERSKGGQREVGLGRHAGESVRTWPLTGKPYQRPVSLISNPLGVSLLKTFLHTFSLRCVEGHSLRLP